jgi:hypothetical protein
MIITKGFGNNQLIITHGFITSESLRKFWRCNSKIVREITLNSILKRS